MKKIKGRGVLVANLLMDFLKIISKPKTLPVHKKIKPPPQKISDYSSGVGFSLYPRGIP